MGKYLIGFQLMVVGMGTVLITLYVLSLFIRLNSKIFNREVSGKNDKEKNNFTANKEIDAGISPEKVVAISAAVYKCLGENESNYRIISIKRNKLNWKR